MNPQQGLANCIPQLIDMVTTNTFHNCTCIMTLYTFITPSLSAPMRLRFFVGDVNFCQNFIGASPMTQFLIGASPMTKFLIGAPPMTKFLIGASPVTIFLIGASPLTLFFNGASPYLQGLKLVQRTASVLFVMSCALPD